VKIAIISPEFPPYNVGGGGIVIDQLARLLAQHNSVNVIFGAWNAVNTSTGGNPILTPVRLMHFPGVSPSLTTSMPPSPHGLLTILRELRRNPDVAHLHGVGHPMVDIAAICCQILGIDYIFTCHGLPLASNPHQPQIRVLYRAYEQLIGLRTLKHATFVIAVSHRIARSLELMGIAPRKIRVSYLVPKVKAIPSVGVSFRDLNQIPAERKIILFIGSISHRKGADLAIQIASTLLSLRRDFVLCLIGQDGGIMNEILCKTRELHITQYVKIMGRVTSSVRDSALETCDLVLFPSRDEPYGLVPLEAIAHRKPVLVSMHSGVAELLKSSKLIFDPYQIESAARTINEILENPGMTEGLVNEASKSIESISAEESEAVYEELSRKSSVTSS
jgi:glycosyltransferase involved in cell wall biosynthesis